VYRTPSAKNLMRRRRHICSDSREASAALAKTTSESCLVWQNMQVLERLTELKKVILVWTRGH
jgi:hypothetical protein